MVITATGATPDMVLAYFLIIRLLLNNHYKFSRLELMPTIRDTFDRIASGWYNYRHRARRWGGGKLLNIGCAHGPDFVPFREDFELYGIDISHRMLEMAQKYAVKYGFTVNLAEGDARNLPFADGSFDRAMAVATYHHIAGEDERLHSLRELHRVLKPGGEAFLTIWNRWQPRFWFRGREIQVPWRTGEDTLYRYYYLFSYGEIKKLVKKAGLEVMTSTPEKAYKFPLKFFSRNICLLVKKAAS
jgi:SAM-dependent methyltransferase